MYFNMFILYLFIYVYIVYVIINMYIKIYKCMQIHKFDIVLSLQGLFYIFLQLNYPKGSSHKRSLFPVTFIISIGIIIFQIFPFTEAC